MFVAAAMVLPARFSTNATVSFINFLMVFETTDYGLKSRRVWRPGPVLARAADVFTEGSRALTSASFADMQAFDGVGAMG